MLLVKILSILKLALINWEFSSIEMTKGLFIYFFFFHHSSFLTQFSSLLTWFLYSILLTHIFYFLWDPCLSTWSETHTRFLLAYPPHSTSLCLDPSFSNPHSASHKIPYLRQRKEKKKNKNKPGPRCVKNRVAQQTFLTFSHLSLPLHLRSKPTIATSQISNPTPITTSQKSKPNNHISSPNSTPTH